MKTLFIVIVSLVFAIGNLIFPDDFIKPEAEPADLFKPVVTETIVTETIPSDAYTGENQDTDDDPYILRPSPLSTAAPSGSNAQTTVPTAAPSAANIGDEIDLLDLQIEDTFERGSSGFGINAGLNDDENIRIIALNNQLTLIPKKSNGWLSWRLRPPVLNDGAVSMEFSITTCARGDRLGLIMRAGDYTSGNGYYFSLACEGTVSILKDQTVLGTADGSNVFNNNSGDINEITAVAQGKTLSLMLNGESLLTVEDAAYSQGFSGFFVAPQGQDTLTTNIISFSEYYNEQ